MIQYRKGSPTRTREIKSVIDVFFLLLVFKFFLKVQAGFACHRYYRQVVTVNCEVSIPEVLRSTNTGSDVVIREGFFVKLLNESRAYIASVRISLSTAAKSHDVANRTVSRQGMPPPLQHSEVQASEGLFEKSGRQSFHENLFRPHDSDACHL